MFSFNKCIFSLRSFTFTVYFHRISYLGKFDSSWCDSFKLEWVSEGLLEQISLAYCNLSLDLWTLELLSCFSFLLHDFFMTSWTLKYMIESRGLNVDFCLMCLFAVILSLATALHAVLARERLLLLRPHPGWIHLRWHWRGHYQSHF